MHYKKSLLVFAFSLSLIACDSLPKGDDGDVELSNDEDLVTYGKTLYTKHCISCHGENGKQENTANPDLTKTKLDEEDIGNLVFHGKGAMPSFEEKLGEPEIRAVSKYVVSLGK
ncbi:MAG: cytochrome c [Bacteroidetes bacterium]|nr:cytochrome c [Bacteroidota bacterium]